MKTLVPGMNPYTRIKHIEQAYERDNGQNTINVRILARRHIVSGLPTNINLINTVLGLVLTQNDLDLLTDIKPAQLFLTENIKDVRRGIRNILNNKRCGGVYIFTNLRTGAQLVGSSTNLSDRLSSYFTSKYIEFENRLIFKDFRRFSLSDYKLEIYIIEKGDFSDILRIKTLVLKRYYIFTKNPTLNALKVAGSTPPNNLDLKMLVELGRKLGKSQAKPLFVYVDNVLTFKASSRNVLSEVSGINQKTIFIKKETGTLIYGAIRISTTLLSNTTENLLNEKDFKVLVSNLRQKSRIVNVSNFIVRHDIYISIQIIAVEATNLVTAETLTAKSLQEMSRLLKNHNYSISYGTIRKYMLSEKIYKN